MAVVHGSCLCGGVKFELADAPKALRYCHCASCKKLSGGAATANVRVPSNAIRILEGEDLLQTFQPAEGSAKTFCLACGSNLFGGGWPESPQCSVRVTAVDEPFEPQPVAHIFVRSVAAWETLPDDGLDRFDTTSS
ncbi:MAG TPA: GFA family protein [Gaiellaceae bacterium]|nr:GFA family protein [Gaiellaceae bacterium]